MEKEYVNREEEMEIDLLELLSEVLSHWKMVVLIAVLFAGIFFGYSKYMIVPQYESSSELYVLSKSTSITSLADLIADNHLCSCSWFTPKGKRTHILYIHGLGTDVELCKSVIEYAVGFVRGRIKIEQRRRVTSDPKAVATSYARGFILGMELMYDEQKDEHPEWGLVVSKPQEVDEYMKSLGERNVRTRKTEFDPLAYMVGQNDGRQFNAQRVLE